MFAHVDGRAFGGSESPRYKILARELDADVACRRDHVRVYVLARGASSRADFDVGAPNGLSSSSQNSWRVALGEALETGGADYEAAVKES